MNKIGACFVCFVLLLSILCGCKTNNNGIDKGESGSKTDLQTGAIILEDFSDILSTYCLAGATRFKSEGTRGEFFESLTDMKGVVAQGVGYASLQKIDNCMVVRFNKTEKELMEIYDEIESMTIRLLVKHGEDLMREIKIFNVAKNLQTNVWTEFTVTKEEMVACLNNYALQNAVSAKEQFVNNFNSTATANEPRLISTICNGYNTDVYIDRITYMPITKE